MAGAVQWTIDQLWKGLQQLYNQIKSVEASLNQDKQELTELYAFAKKEYDPAGAYDRAMLEPVIHRNTELRLNYLQPIKQKYLQAVNLATAELKKRGYTAPVLSGLGDIVIAPAAAITIVIVALSAVAAIALLTQSQRDRTATLKYIMGDNTTTPEQKLALVKGMKDEIDKENKTPSPLNPLGNMDWLVPALAIVAVLVLAPTVLKALPGRRAAA
jgi:hypothetical protein